MCFVKLSRYLIIIKLDRVCWFSGPQTRDSVGLIGQGQPSGVDFGDRRTCDAGGWSNEDDLSTNEPINNDLFVNQPENMIEVPAYYG